MKRGLFTAVSLVSLLLFTFGCAGGTYDYTGSPDSGSNRVDGDADNTPPISSKYKVTSIKFLESGGVVPEQGSRKFSDTFSKSASRYIYCQVDMANPTYNNGDAEYEFLYRFYKSSGEWFGEARYVIALKSEWENAVHLGCYGWEDPGNWTSGSYRVEVWINGEKSGMGTFTIVDAGSSVADDKKAPVFRLEHIKMFEGGYTAPDISARSYVNSFHSKTTRYIFCEIKYTNPNYRGSDVSSAFSFKFLRMDGSLVGDHKYDLKISSSLESAVIWGGWGSNTGGTWPAGIYRVEAYVDHKKAGEKTFSVY